MTDYLIKKHKNEKRKRDIEFEIEQYKREIERLLKRIERLEEERIEIDAGDTSILQIKE